MLTRRAIRFDGRKAIESVSARYSRAATERLVREFRRPTLLAWAKEDLVFPLAPARGYARRLSADLRTVGDSCTYLPEDRPERTAEVLRE